MGSDKNINTGLLLSGGMDSIAVAWWKRPNWALTIDYGQKAAVAEIRAAAQVCEELGIRHEIIAVDCSGLGSGDMAQKPPETCANTTDWWPFRNQLIITLASMRAIACGIQKLYIGSVKCDGDNHLDGTAEFVTRMDRLIASQEGSLRLAAPAIKYTTTELVRMALVPPGLLAWAHSCHVAETACGSCRGCNKYLASFAELERDYLNVWQRASISIASQRGSEALLE